MLENNKAILEKANAAVARGDYEEFLSFCTDDTEWTFVGDQTLSGKQAVRQWMTAEYREPPSNKVENTVAEGDFLVVFGEITVKDKSGEAIRSSYCDVWRFQDGKMAELKAFVVQMDAEN